MRRDMQCTFCGKPLSGGLDTFGEVGQEVCGDCNAEQMTDAEIGQREAEARRKPCPSCGEWMYESIWEPGLFHCPNCKHWWDYVRMEGWTFHPAATHAQA